MAIRSSSLLQTWSWASAVSCPARVKKSGGGTIPARRLLDYVRLLPDADVQVKIQDNHWASLTCGRSKTRIAGMSRESFPELPKMPEVLAEIPIGVLASMIGKTIFSISSEESRFTLNGALMVLRKGGLAMVATDGHRLAMVESTADLPGITGAYRALLPKKAMSELQKLAGDSDPAAIVHFSGDENHLFFQLGDRLLLSRKLTGNFPDYERVLPKEHGASGHSRTRRTARSHRARRAIFRRAFARHPRPGREGRNENPLVGF